MNLKPCKRNEEVAAIGPAGSRVLAVVGALVCVAVTGSTARADRCGISVKKQVEISEPAQRAIIGHNGIEELIILQTEVKASRATKILEFMPLPAKPKVELVPKDCFDNLGKLLKKHGVSYWVPGAKSGGARRKSKSDPEPVIIVFKEKVGPHDITVVEVTKLEAFVTWIADYFEDHELGFPNLTASHRKIVAGYLAREVRFFVFDLVEAGPRQRTIQPVSYQFPSVDLYYPLEVTNIYGGKNGVVELFIITPRDLGISYIEIPARGAMPGSYSRSTEATVTPEELTELHAALPVLVSSNSATLQAYRYKGKLSFHKDLRVCTGRRDPAAQARAFVTALNAGKMDEVIALVATPFAIAGKSPAKDDVALRAALEQLMAAQRLSSVVGESVAIAVDMAEPGLTASATSEIVLQRFSFAPGDPSFEFVKTHFGDEQVHVVWIDVGDRRVLVVVGPSSCDATLYRVLGLVEV